MRQWMLTQFQTAFGKIVAQRADVNRVACVKGAVFTEDASTTDGAGRVNTWEYAYNIALVHE